MLLSEHRQRISTSSSIFFPKVKDQISDHILNFVGGYWVIHVLVRAFRWPLTYQNGFQHV